MFLAFVSLEIVARHWNTYNCILFCWNSETRGIQVSIRVFLCCGIFQSKSLQHLDVASCRGVYLSEMLLPNLTTFIVSRNPLGVELSDGSFWQGRYTDRPCIYDVLRSGALRLSRLNDHALQSDWCDNVYGELDQILRSVCSCYNHRPS